MVPPFPFLPDRSYPDSLLAKKTEEALAPGRVDLKVVALTGTGCGGRTGHPAAVGCPARPLGSAVQPSVPPLPPARPNRWPGLARPAPSPSASGPVPGPAEEGGGLPRSEGDSCQSLELKRRESRGPLASHTQRSKTEDGGLKECAKTLQRSQANR